MRGAFETLGLSPRAHVGAEGLGVNHVHWLAYADGDVDVFGAKVVKRAGINRALSTQAMLGSRYSRPLGQWESPLRHMCRTCPVGIPTARGL